jgi:putative endonuclease
VEQHKMKYNPKSFTARYNVDYLVYYEQYFDIGEAIEREKQIKAGTRQKKIDMINSFNLKWRDLFDQL